LATFQYVDTSTSGLAGAVYTKVETDGLLASKQATLSSGSVPDPATQLTILEGGVVRSLDRDDTLTMTTASNRITLGVDDTVMARHTSVASAISDLATFQYVDTTTAALLTAGLSGKQDALAFNVPSGGISLYADGSIVKGLKAAAPITMTEAANAITVGLEADTYEPVFSVVAPLLKYFNFISNTNNVAIDQAALNPFWVAGQINGSTLDKLSNKGNHDYTVTRPSTGLYWISWTDPHPEGVNFTVTITGNGLTGNAWNVLQNFSPNLNTAYGFYAITRDSNFVLLNGSFCFQVLA